jgi:phosphate transport system ATP-binding protein
MSHSPVETTRIRVADLSFSYRKRAALRNIHADFAESTITALVGPSGAGKSTFLTTLNGLWQTIPEARMSGQVLIRLEGAFRDIYAEGFPVSRLRRRVGMVFQTPNPLPMSIFRNIAFPLKLAGENRRDVIEPRVEAALRRAYLWEEVKDRLGDNALTLSGGQQQRLCIARALVLEPQVLLLDEPTSSLDETAGRVIEELLVSLKDRLTLLVVSHYTDQVKRIADRVLTFSNGSIDPSNPAAGNR